MRRAIEITVIGLLAAIAGCGGGLSQDDMRRSAIRRPSENTEPASRHSGQADRQKSGKNDTTSPTSGGRRDSHSEQVPSSRASGATGAVQAGNASASRVAGDGQRAENITDHDTARATTSSTTVPAATNRPPAVQPPQGSLTLQQRRQRTLDNLTKLGAALRQYCEKNGCLFSRAMCNARQQPMLSWRVELLPYLGYQELYDQFDPTEPWDSPRNKPLLELIPPVYQSPERFDMRTNYLVPVASFTAFSQTRRLGLRRLEDGAASTVMLLEVDDSDAVPWTKPDDLQLDLKTISSHVGTLRQNGFFVVWGDGSVTRVAAECGPRDLRAIFTRDGGDSFAAYLARAPITSSAVAKTGGTASAPASGNATHPSSHAPRDAELVRSGSTSREPARDVVRSPQPARLPIPNALSLEQARTLIGDIYHDDYEKTRSVREQRAFAQRMLKEAGRVSADPAGQYVLLGIVIKIASQAGDGTTALAALDQLVSRFDINELQVTSDLLQQLAKRKDRDRTLSQMLLDKAEPLVDRALKEEQFDVAESMCQIALGAARQLDNRPRENSLAQQKNLVGEARRAYKAIQRTITSLEDADDPAANLKVGRYYCLVRGEWDKGLPLLAKGNDPQLKELADAELRQPTIAADQLKLAEGWWQVGEEDSARQKAAAPRRPLVSASTRATAPRSLENQGRDACETGQAGVRPAGCITSHRSRDRLTRRSRTK